MISFPWIYLIPSSILFLLFLHLVMLPMKCLTFLIPTILLVNFKLLKNYPNNSFHIAYSLELTPLWLAFYIHPSLMVESPLNYVIMLVTSATLSPPYFIPIARNSLPPFIQCGKELIIKTFWSQREVLTENLFLQ